MTMPSDEVFIKMLMKAAVACGANITNPEEILKVAKWASEQGLWTFSQGIEIMIEQAEVAEKQAAILELRTKADQLEAELNS